VNKPSEQVRRCGFDESKKRDLVALTTRSCKGLMKG
jgi:hypothetical protein